MLARQACVSGHSALTTHSGRQDGGLPTSPGWQEHTAWSYTTRHMLFGPQGDGSQGLDGTAEKLETKCYNTRILQTVVLFSILSMILYEVSLLLGHGLWTVGDCSLLFSHSMVVSSSTVKMYSKEMYILTLQEESTTPS